MRFFWLQSLVGEEQVVTKFTPFKQKSALVRDWCVITEKRTLQNVMQLQVVHESAGIIVLRKDPFEAKVYFNNTISQRNMYSSVKVQLHLPNIQKIALGPDGKNSDCIDQIAYLYYDRAQQGAKQWKLLVTSTQLTSEQIALFENIPELQRLNDAEASSLSLSTSTNQSLQEFRSMQELDIRWIAHAGIAVLTKRHVIYLLMNQSSDTTYQIAKELDYEVQTSCQEVPRPSRGCAITFC